jgi:methylamine--corrinoid protein Co-methyltransferase
MLEDDFDMSLFRSAERLRNEFSITYDRDNPVPSDDDLNDRVFQAGMQLYLETGTYCVDSGRTIKFTDREIEEALASAPSSVTFGGGKDAREVVHRGVESSIEPIICAGVQTAVFSNDEMAFKIYKGCAEYRCVDGIWGGVVGSLEGGYDVVAGTPGEIYAYRGNVHLMRKAIAAAGRPDMLIINNAPKSAATIGMYDPESGLRRSDGCSTAGVSEMKINYDDLDRTAYALAAGIPIRGSHVSVIGGFSGSIEGAAIVSVAGAFQSLMVNKGRMIGAGTVPFRIKSKCTRECLWVGAVVLQALNRNTNLPLCGSIGDHPAAGPGTKQYLYESAAGFIANSVSGGHHLAGTRKFVIGSTPNYGTPLESRWMGEVSKSVAGMKRERANEIARYLLSKYEDTLTQPPDGYTYEELYDVGEEQPGQMYKDLYDEVKQELAERGVDFKSW